MNTYDDGGARAGAGKSALAGAERTCGRPRSRGRPRRAAPRARLRRRGIAADSTEIRYSPDCAICTQADGHQRDTRRCDSRRRARDVSRTRPTAGESLVGLEVHGLFVSRCSVLPSPNRISTRPFCVRRRSPASSGIVAGAGSDWSVALEDRRAVHDGNVRRGLARGVLESRRSEPEHRPATQRSASDESRSRDNDRLERRSDA